MLFIYIVSISIAPDPLYLHHAIPPYINVA